MDLDWIFENWKSLALLSLVFCLSVSLLPFHRPVGWDESIYFLNARKIAGQYTPYDELKWRAPVISQLLLIFGVENNLELAKLIPGLFLWLFVMLILYGSKKYGIGPLPALVTLLLPLLILESKTVATDVPAAFVGSLGILSGNPLIAGTLIGLAFLIRYPAGLFLLVGFVFYPKKIPQLTAMFLLVVSSIFIHSYLEYGSPLQIFLNYPNVITLLHPELVQQKVGDPVYKYLLLMPEFLTLPILILLVYSLTNPQPRFLLWVVIIVIGMSIFDVKEARYLIPVLPALLFQAFSVKKFQNLVFVLFLLMAIPILFYMFVYPTSNSVQTVGVWAGENSIVIYNDWAVPQLMYYSNKPISGSLIWNKQYITGTEVFVAEAGCKSPYLELPEINVCRKLV